MKAIRYINTFAIVLALWISTTALHSQSNATKTSYFLNNSIFRSELNPALQPDRGYLNIMGIGNTMVNFNLGKLSVDKLVFLNEAGNPDFAFNDAAKRKELIDGLDPLNKIQADVNLQPFGLGFYTGKIFWRFNLGLKDRLLMQMPRSFFEAFVKCSTQDIYSMNEMKYSNINYLDADFGVSFPITEYVTFGTTFKYIKGIQYLDLAYDKLDLSMNQSTWAIDMKGTMRSSMSGYQGPVNGKFDFDMYGKGIKDGLISPAGTGYGLDLGIVIKPIKNISVSLAVVDLGTINWSKESNTLSDITYNQVLLDPKKNINDQMKDLPDPTLVNVSPEAFSTKLPTSYNAGIEFSLWDDKMSFGMLSTNQTGDYKSSELTFSANMKPIRAFNTAFSYTNCSNGVGAYGVAINWVPSWFFNFFFATDYIYSSYTTDYLPIKGSQVNYQVGVTFPLSARKLEKKAPKITLNNAPIENLKTIENGNGLLNDTIVSKPILLAVPAKNDTIVFKPQVDSIATDSMGVTRIDSTTMKVRESVNKKESSMPTEDSPKNQGQTPATIDNSNKQIIKPE
ncbi:MAG: DUF5723 family protein [Bacteroidales bacterium]